MSAHSFSQVCTTETGSIASPSSAGVQGVRRRVRACSRGACPLLASWTKSRHDAVDAAKSALSMPKAQLEITENMPIT